MVVLHVPASPLLGAVAAASAHGLTDLKRPPHELVPYGVVMLPAIMPSFPSEAVTAMFLACSWQHFARDIGHVRSFWLHMGPQSSIWLHMAPHLGSITLDLAS